MAQEKYLICCALPYANGPLHVGHLAGCYLPGDIYARYRRLQGHDVHFVCGSDEHGVAISVRARKEGITPQEVVDRFHQEIQEDLKLFQFSANIYSRTTHPDHINRSQDFFLRLLENGFIEKKEEKRLYCESCKEFLPDRYVIGTCPSCGSEGARGDQCEACGTWYEPEELIDPVCQICGTTKASFRETTHWYLKLDKLEPQLREWLESKTHWRKNVLGYAFQPLKAEIAPRAITRDLEWGVPVPLEEARDKVLYVWFDAPIGYISASEEWAKQQGEPDKWKHYWEDPETKLIHFIGKDNIIFHTVVWPAILMGDGRYVLPHLVAGNEFLNLEGQKISTSRNFAVWAKEAAEAVGDVDLLRFYIARIAPETSDSNFSWKDFQQRVNGELADIVGNLARRTLSFLQKNYQGVLAPESPALEQSISREIQKRYKNYCSAMDQGLVKTALEEVIELGRFLNGFLQESAPWKTRKEDPEKAYQDLYSACRGIKAVALLLAPYCPEIAGTLWKQLGYSTEISEHNLNEVLETFSANQKTADELEPIVQKIEDEFVEEQVVKLAQSK